MSGTPKKAKVAKAAPSSLETQHSQKHAVPTGETPLPLGRQIVQACPNYRTHTRPRTADLTIPLALAARTSRAARLFWGGSTFIPFIPVPARGGALSNRSNPSRRSAPDAIPFIPAPALFGKIPRSNRSCRSEIPTFWGVYIHTYVSRPLIGYRKKPVVIFRA